MKNDIRALACEIAKELAKAAGTGRKPNEFMKQAWAGARAQKETPTPILFWTVEYKMLRGGTQRAIVGASTKEAAALKFNNPGEVGGPRAEIKGVTVAKKISQGQQVTVVNSEGIWMSGIATWDILLDGADKSIEIAIKGKLHYFPLIAVVSATKPTKEPVIAGMK